MECRAARKFTMERMPTKKSTISRLLAPIRVERRDDTALTVSTWTIKKRIRQMSATPSIAVTIQRCSGEKWYPIMPASASDRPMTPKGIVFKVHFHLVESTTR